MSYTAFLLDIQQHVAQVRINRPAQANALDQTSWEELPRLMQQLDADPAVRVIVLGGSGKHFCAGIDTQMLMAMNPVHIKEEGRKREHIFHTISRLQAALTAVEQCGKPVIAAIHGACIGAGLELVAACDLRYASEEAYVQLKEIDLGIVADLGGLQRLPHLIPAGIVRELAFTGRRMPAAEALQRGLVNQVFPSPEALQTAASALATEIAAKSPLVTRGIKRSLNYARDHSVEAGLRDVATWNAATLLSSDLAQAVQAQLTKQSPTFED
jgi:enoyl-CoA hydratase